MRRSRSRECEAGARCRLDETCDAGAIDAVERQLQRLDPKFHARTVDGIHDMLIAIGDLTDAEIAERTESGEAAATLVATGGGPTQYTFHAPGPEKSADGMGMLYRAGAPFKDIGGAQFDPEHAASSTAIALQPLWVKILYVIGMLSCVYHFANGLWTQGITWGLWTSAAAQRPAGVFFFLCFLWFCAKALNLL